MIVLNGARRADTPSLAVLLDELGLGLAARGVAVAVDGEVVPRSEWAGLTLSDGSRVEVVDAIQGG
ncbi:MAG TPA: sulfur carrier protein ThiS [Solirubrobacteraceae bacterium]|jgi:sulfur carrier protein|nr:sulfur carrier protein ThiS [Solirubrobacteraceae bacterium]